MWARLDDLLCMPCRYRQVQGITELWWRILTIGRATMEGPLDSLWNYVPFTVLSVFINNRYINFLLLQAAADMIRTKDYDDEHNVSKMYFSHNHMDTSIVFTQYIYIFTSGLCPPRWALWRASYKRRRCFIIITCIARLGLRAHCSYIRQNLSKHGVHRRPLDSSTSDNTGTSTNPKRVHYYSFRIENLS